MDLKNEGWRDYSMFEKGLNAHYKFNSRVYKILNAHYKFDLPLDPKRVDKYLAGHLHSSKAA